MNHSPLLIAVMIEPKSHEDWQELVESLAFLSAGDSRLRVATDPADARAVLEGESEEHLRAALRRLREVCEVETRAGAPRVAYRERLSRRQEIDYTHRPSGRSGPFARLRMAFEPKAEGPAHLYEGAIFGDSLPEEFLAGVERGVASAAESGCLAGFPIVDLKATLLDGAYDDRSCVLAFEAAARAATREALLKGGCVLLEPIMALEVTTPEDCAELVADDLRGRRAPNVTRNEREDGVVVEAEAPLAELLGYGETLDALSQGRAAQTMRFRRYAPAPSSEDEPLGAQATLTRNSSLPPESLSRR
jgi:elongation factor G